MKYEQIALQADYHAAAEQYVTEVYGQDVLNAFPPIPTVVLDCILAGCPEAQTHLEVYIDYRVQPTDKRKE